VIDENVRRIELTIPILLPADRPPTEAEVRAIATQLRAGFPVAEEDFEALLRRVYAKTSISMDMGVALVSEHRPWLNSRKPSIDPFFWERFDKLLKKKGWPTKVVTALDSVTDELLDLSGNPAQTDHFKIRGLVVGDVQSGKTATYTGLACKAGDAGYRLIILLTGTLENLRRQTQERLDEGFVGLDSSGELTTIRTSRQVGVGIIDPRRAAGVFTSRLRDFNKALVESLGFRLDGFHDPVLVVIKKQKSILTNLEKWLVDFNADSNGRINVPVLVIDDEADNASVNTRSPDEDPAEINRRIRSLLSRFTHSSYLGFTATPFANVFIDPDTTDEMIDNDLFPRDFIYGLEPPTNYIGPQAIFGEAPVRNILRFIEDADAIFPERHKSSLVVNELPESLLESTRFFLLATTIRDLRAEGPTHRSMLINVSHFTAVQNQVTAALHTWLSQLQQDVRNYSQLSVAEALRNGNLAALQDTWKREFSQTEFTWDDVQAALVEGLLPVTVRAVNQKNKAASLNFKLHEEHGLRVIVVGGNSLSRGLTLEGLNVSYFFRFTKMYDSLLQMGRWFGYRDGYEDLCRVWLTEEVADWYSHITAATAELRLELRKMRDQKRKPIDFGLKVRAHPDALMVTAQNKMRTSTLIRRVVSISKRSLETTYIKTLENVVVANTIVTEKFMRRLSTAGFGMETSGLNNPIWRLIPKRLVADFLEEFSVDAQNVSFQTKDLAAFIASTEETFLQEWDVVIPQGSGDETEFGGIAVRPVKRAVQVYPNTSTVRISGKSARIASPGIEQEGLDAGMVAQLSAAYKIDNPGKTVPDHVYREQRPRPLLLIYLVTPVAKGNDTGTIFPNLIALGLSFREFDDSDVARQVDYRINLVELRYGGLGNEEYEEDEDGDELN
jgi:Z1 domain